MNMVENDFIGGNIFKVFDGILNVENGVSK
jgi:hypothetical protein